MSKTVHMAVYDTFSDWEVGHATAHINRELWHRDPGTWQVKTVGLTADPVTSMGGMRVLPDLVIDDLKPADSAMLILPGLGTEFDPESPITVFARKAREFLAAGVPVAAICGATFGLAKEGLLDARPHTSNDPGYLGYSGYSGAEHYVPETAVIDGDLITATGTRPVDFAREILARLEIFEPHVLESWYKLYANNDPAGFYELYEYEQQQAAGR